MRQLCHALLLIAVSNAAQVAHGQAFEIIVADKTANAVLRYDGPSGAFIDALVPPASGLSLPVDVVVGPRGDLFVAQYGGTVLRFRGTDGGFLGAFYQNEHGSIEELVGARFGLGKLHLLGNDSGNIVLANASTGAEVASYGVVSLARQFALGPDGLLYVTHSGPFPRIRVYDPATRAMVREFGSSSAVLTGITVGPDGLVYVADYNRGTVQRYTRLGASAGMFINTGPNLERPSALRFGPDGHLYVSTGGVTGYPGDIRRFHGTTGAFMGVVVPNGVGGLSQPRGFTFRRKPEPPLEILVVDRDSWALKRYDAISGEFIDDFIAGPLLEEARNVEIGLDGQLYVTLFNYSLVRRFDARSGQYLGVFFDGESDSLGSFKFEELVATRFAWTPGGPRAYILSNDDHNIAVCDGLTGEFISELAKYDIWFPHDMFVGPEGHLYIANEHLSNGTLQVWNPITGQRVRGGGPSALVTGLCLGPDGLLYATDWWDNRVVRRNAQTLGSVDVFVPSGTDLYRPSTVQFGPDGLLYVITGGTSGLPGDIRCYNPLTKQSHGVFIPNGAGGLDSPRAMLFRPRVWPSGDCNCDGTVDFADIGSFVLALSDPAGYTAAYTGCDPLTADCNGDSLVDGRDIQAFVNRRLPH